jgi:sugar fermentation stimulation protein A
MYGSYVLILELKQDSTIQIGSLGNRFFKKGFYAYVGSATGVVSIRQRVDRHKRLAQEKSGKIHWHIDYLLTDEKTELLEVLESEGKECDISQLLNGIADDAIVGFGSSDCTEGCIGHLYYFEKNPYNQIWDLLERLRFGK